MPKTEQSRPSLSGQTTSGSDHSGVSVEARTEAHGSLDFAAKRSRKFDGDQKRVAKKHWRIWPFYEASVVEDSDGHLSENDEVRRHRQVAWTVGIVGVAAVSVSALLMLWNNWVGTKSDGLPPPHVQDAKPNQGGTESTAPQSRTSRGESPETASTEEQAPAGEKILTVSVNSGPLPGQDSRATPDFRLRPPPAATVLEWRIIEPECRGAVFGVTQNIEFSFNNPDARDKSVRGDLTHGTVTPVIAGEELYIGGVRNAPKTFTVEVFAR